EGSGKKAKSSGKEGVSKKRTEEEFDQESSKRKKTSESSELAKEPRDKEVDELSQKELQQMMIIVPVQGINVEALQTKYLIIDWKIYTEGTKKYWKIIRVRNHTEIYTEGTKKYWKIIRVRNHTESASCFYKEGNRHLHASREGVSIVKRNSYIDAGSKDLVDQDNEMSRELLRKIFMQAERPRR
nr:hypothetical protein [Tanacetum cinerariifolium]